MCAWLEFRRVLCRSYAFIVVVESGVAGSTVAGTVAGRERDKEAVSYSLLWGQTALTVLLAACAVLGLKQRLGL